MRPKDKATYSKGAMAFNKMSNKRRRRPRRKRKTTVRSLARRVRTLEIAPERKFIDGFDTLADVPLTTATIPTNVLNVIPQGTGEAQRIGDKVHLSSIQLDYWFQPVAEGPGPGANNPCTALVRFIVVWFPGVGAGTATDIDIRNVLQANSCQSFYRRNGQVNYRVMHDRTYECEFGGAYDAATPPALRGYPLANSAHHHRCAIKLNKHSTYSDAAGSVIKGTLCYYTLQQTTGAGTVSLVKCETSTRLTYEDE